MRIYEKENKAKQTLILRRSEDFQEDCKYKAIQIKQKWEPKNTIYKLWEIITKKCKKFVLKKSENSKRLWPQLNIDSTKLNKKEKFKSLNSKNNCLR